mgnify:CR=1 FL=1
MSKHGKDHPDEFMSNGHDCLFEGESFLALLEEVFPKHIVVPCYLCSHEPDNSSKMSISSLGYPALPYVPAGLVDSRIEPCVSDELFAVIETVHISNFGQEVDSSYISDALNGFEDLKVFYCTLLAHIGQDAVELFDLFFEQKELRDFLREDELSSRARVSYGISCQGYDLFRRDTGLSSFAFWFDELRHFRGRKGLYHPGRWIVFEEVEDPFGVDVCGLKKFWERDGKEFFYVVFKARNLKGELFPLPYQFTEVGRKKAGFPKGAVKHAQEACDDKSVFLVGLGFPKGEFHEIGDEERIDDYRMVTFFGEKGREVNMITGGGLLSDEDKVLLELQKILRELLKPFPIHRCGDFKELLSSLIDSACREGILRNIDADEYLIHDYTSQKALGQGQDLPPYQSSILTRATYAQPTYHGLGRQGTDSLKGFMTQVNEVLLPQP